MIADENSPKYWAIALFSSAATVKATYSVTVHHVNSLGQQKAAVEDEIQLTNEVTSTEILQIKTHDDYTLHCSSLVNQHKLRVK